MDRVDRLFSGVGDAAGNDNHDACRNSPGSSEVIDSHDLSLPFLVFPLPLPCALITFPCVLTAFALCSHYLSLYVSVPFTACPYNALTCVFT